jgi:outer membrane receptor protein involved in Fe transport
MFRHLLAFSAILFSFNSHAQFSTDQNSQRPDSLQNRNIPKTGMIAGTVLDQDGKPLEFAAVAVFTLRDSVLAGGTLTDDKGKFTVTDLPGMGRFRLKISFIGLSTYQSQPILLTMQNSIYNTGNIKMEIAGKNLNEVDITAEKNDFQNTIDKKVYNVDKNIVNTGGSATDVLQNIPSVTVDQDGNVALRGSGSITVYIDGKPSTLTGGNRQAILQQIPASAIEEIEVVTNPSAKYDAEGMAGIINIKTRKGKLRGLNGNASLSAGTNNKYNASIGLNNRSAKTNIYGNYSYRSDERRSSSDGLQVYKNPVLFNSIETHTAGEQQNDFHTFKGGIDYNINNENTLGLSGSYSLRNEDDPDQTISLLNYSDNTILDALRSNQTDEKNNTVEGTLDYRRTFKESKKELTASGTYSLSNRDETQNYFNGQPVGLPYQINKSNAEITAATLQSDYVVPMRKSKLETGVKASERQNDNDVHADLLSDNIYVNDIRYTDHFIYTEYIYAAYALYSGKIKSFDFSAGLRGEEAMTEGNSKATDEIHDNNYFSLFPSAAIKYNWKKTNDLQLSYSRRTNRPNINSLNPFTDYSDTLNIRTGNPDLLPEYIHSGELSYSKTMEKVTASATVYYRHIDDVITRYRLVDPQTGVSTNTVLNFTSGDNIGMEGIFRYQFKPGSIMWSFNIFSNTVNGKNIDPDISGTNTNWNTRLTANLKLAKNLSLQLTGMYSAPDKQPQRTIRSMMSGVDAGLKYDFWKGKGSLSLNGTDLFNTRKFDIHMEQDDYIFDSIRKRESRVGTLTFAYRFGSQDNPFVQRKKKQNPVQEGSGEVEGGE